MNKKEIYILIHNYVTDLKYEIRNVIKRRRFYGIYKIDKKIIDIFFKPEEMGIFYTKRWKIVRIIQFIIPDFIKKVIERGI